MTAQKLILDRIQERLALITTANGYPFDVITIKRSPSVPTRTEDMPSINFWPNDTRLIKNRLPHDDYEMDLAIEVLDEYSEDDNAIDKGNELGDSVWIALHRSALYPSVSDAINERLGCMVQELSMQREMIRTTEPWLDVILMYSIKYSTRQGNPYELNI